MVKANMPMTIIECGPDHSWITGNHKPHNREEAALNINNNAVNSKAFSETRYLL